MARKTVLVSDLSGATIKDGKGATIRITFRDARRGSYEADVTDGEAQAFIGQGLRPVARRGRKPKAKG